MQLYTIKFTNTQHKLYFIFFNFNVQIIQDLCLIYYYKLRSNITYCYYVVIKNFKLY